MGRFFRFIYDLGGAGAPFWGVQLLLATILKREKMMSWAFSARNLKTSLGIVSGPRAFLVDAR